VSVPEPYRIFFPLGLAFAVVAALVWPLYAAGLIAYPASTHWALMIQGFLPCFIFGFLLTALPAFLHAERTTPAETLIAAGAMAAFGILTLAGRIAAAEIAFLIPIAVAVQAAVRRMPRRRGDPPEEFVFVVLGLAFGAAGGILGAAAGAGLWTEPATRYALHLVSRGMALSIVMGVGGLLVPTFSAMREPLVIPGIARPGQRGPRRLLYLPLLAFLLAAAVLDAQGMEPAAAWLRVVVCTVLGGLVWKLFRLPGRPNLLSYTIWGSGWFLLAGVWVAALLPARAIVGFHIGFLGGFGLLILGIATRVVVSHGGYPPAHERRVLRPFPIAALMAALLARILSEVGAAYAAPLHAVSGTLWIAGWLAWAWEAVPCMVRKGVPALVAPTARFSGKP
jgi:uncharacterized protein involved in response to NO